ncbi:MAG TPA: hypothetical protein VEJ38_11105 [Candidatus Acidoferrales bacterium]|nr:hypothetical protein [Candidatus Acidoferrales bacterium]
MKRILTLVAALALPLVAAGVLLAQGNPFVGTWKLNVAKSKFTGIQAPKSETRTVVAQGQGEKLTYEGTAADGSPIAYSFATNLDGKDSPISGSHPLGSDTVAVTRVDANTVTSISKKAGKTIFRTRTVVSKDGKVSTQTTKGVNGDGQPINITTVWDKQ